jgi:hypothetical protein
MSLAGLLLPATMKVLQASNRVDRRIAALRCVEAIRLYAAEHGRLPNTLEAVRSVPIPNNPTTGTPFEYEIDGERTILTVPSPSRTTSAKYEIRIRK